MGDVNTATQEETAVPSTEVPLPPSKEATDRSQYTTQSLDAPLTDRPHPPVHEVHSAPVLGQVKLLPPSYYASQHHNRSVTETRNEPSNQNAAGSTSAVNSHPTSHTKPVNRQPSSIKELERDMANTSVSQQAPCSSHPSSQEGQPSGVSSNIAASRTQYQASQSASITGNNQSGVPPLQSMSHNEYPPQGVPTQRVLPTSPPAVPGLGDELVRVNAPPRQAEVSAGRQPTQPGGGSQLLIAPNSAVRKNYISDNEIDSPSGTTQNFPPNASLPTGKIKEPGYSVFQRVPQLDVADLIHSQTSSYRTSPEKAMTHSRDHLPPVTQTNTVSVPHEPRAPVPPPQTEPQEGSSQHSSSQSIAQTPQSSSGGSSRGSAGGRRLKGSSYRLESQQPTIPPHSVDQRASVHQQPPANAQYPPPQANHGQYQPSVSSVRYPMATGGQLNASAPPPSGHTSSHHPPSSGQPPSLQPSTNQPPMLLPSSVQQPLQSSFQPLQPLQPSGAQQPPGPMPPSSGYPYPVAGQVSAQPQYQAGQFWALPTQQYLYYQYPVPWNYYPPQQNMYPHPPYQIVPPGFPHQGVPPGHPPQTIPPGHSQQSVPPGPRQPREGDPPPGTSHNPQTAGASVPSGGAMLETREGEDEEISEGTVAGTPHEAQSQDEGECRVLQCMYC